MTARFGTDSEHRDRVGAATRAQEARDDDGAVCGELDDRGGEGLGVIAQQQAREQWHRRIAARSTDAGRAVAGPVDIHGARIGESAAADNALRHDGQV